MSSTTAKWVRSSRCSAGACVEVAYLGADMVGVRDSKNPQQPPLVMPRADWYAFLDQVSASVPARS